MTDSHTNVAYLYHCVIELAVRIVMTLSKDERDLLVSMLLHEAAKDPEVQTTLFLQSAVNYIRSISDV